MGKMGIPNKESFVCLCLADRDICAWGVSDGWVWAGEWPRSLARAYSCIAVALSFVRDSSAISCAGAWCRKSYGPLSKAGLDGRDSLVRAYEFLQPTEITLLTDRRVTKPYGLEGRDSGEPGRNRFTQDAVESDVTGKCSFEVQAGDALTIETPGGGGYGTP